MNLSITRALVVVALSLAGFLSTGAARAQAIRFVSILGNDANACTLTKPCRTLHHAVDLTPAGGEVDVIDSGGYGAPVTIARSITISGHGQSVFLTGAIVINGTTASVTLRDLLLSGRGVVDAGIFIDNAVDVHIVRCEFERFKTNGLRSDAGPARLSIVDSIFRDNGSDGLFVTGAYSFQTPATNAVLTISNSRFEGNAGTGASIVSVAAEVKDSLFARNAVGVAQNNGRVNATALSAIANRGGGYLVGSSGVVTLLASTLEANAFFGLFVGNDCIAVLTKDTIMNNPTGVNNQGTVYSAKDSTIFLNQSGFSGNPFQSFGQL